MAPSYIMGETALRLVCDSGPWKLSRVSLDLDQARQREGWGDAELG